MDKILRSTLFVHIIVAVIKAWCLTLHCKDRGFRRYREALRRGERVIFVGRHRDLLLAVPHEVSKVASTLASSGPDGEKGAQVAHALGIPTIRGSSTQRGAAVLLEMMDRGGLQRESFNIVADGPKGPAGISKLGAIYMASRTGIPLVPVAFVCRRVWTLRTWDRMQIPMPFARIESTFGAAITVDPDLDRSGLERVRDQLDEVLTTMAPAAVPSREQLDGPSSRRAPAPQRNRREAPGLITRRGRVSRASGQ